LRDRRASARLRAPADVAAGHHRRRIARAAASRLEVDGVNPEEDDAIKRKLGIDMHAGQGDGPAQPHRGSARTAPS